MTMVTARSRGGGGEGASSSSDSESDGERLREAVDSALHPATLFTGGKEEKSVKLAVKEDPVKPLKKSLRRDRNEENDEPSARVSDLEVTPQFQSFIATQLDKLLESKITEVSPSSLGHKTPASSHPTSPASHPTTPASDPTPPTPHPTPPTPHPTVASGLRLLKSSQKCVEKIVHESVPQRRPDLLKHRKRKKRETDGTSSDDEASLAEAAVSTEWVLSKEGAKGFANRFESRVEPGEERIKKKKKKVKKNKKKKAGTGSSDEAPTTNGKHATAAPSTNEVPRLSDAIAAESTGGKRKKKKSKKCRKAESPEEG